jgi:TetR/AcrR family transcriptional regulator, tetracycline repressor protein
MHECQGAGLGTPDIDGVEVMDERDGLPPLPWWQGREARRAERADRRRQRHDERAAKHQERSEGQRDPVTSDRVADAALRILDAEGLDALTVRRLAQEMGVGTMTLYWYVRNKDEVLDLVADRIFAGIEVPDVSIGWREGSAKMAITARAAMLRHRAAMPIMISRGSLGPNSLLFMERALALLRSAGFGASDAADAYYALSNFVLGFCAAEASGPGIADRPDVDRRAYGQMLLDYMRALPEDRFPNLKESAPRLFAGSLDQRFAFALEAMLDGLQVRIDAAGARTPAATAASSKPDSSARPA